MDAQGFLAGAAVVDITPSLGTCINGDFIPYYAHTIHSKLYSKALALKSGVETVVLVVVDICYMQDDFIRPIRKAVCQKTGLPGKSFMFSCTHAHSAGAVAGLFLADADPAYTRKLPGLIIESVMAALEKLFPAKIAFGSVDVPEHIVCRRYFMQEGYEAYNPVTGKNDKVKTNPFGAESQVIGPVASMDTQLSFLAVKSVDDQWISLFANYSLHYVGDFQNGTISADYFGEFSAQLKHVLKAGEDFVGILSNGTSGEANIWDFLNNDRYPREDFEKTKLIASCLAERVAASVSSLVWDNQFVIATRYEELYLPIAKPSMQELEEARKLVEETHFEKITAVDNDVLRRIYAREQVLLSQEGVNEIFPIQAIKIGNGVIGTLAGEFFAETGLWLKKNTRGKNYFSIGLANGGVGYVPPEHEMERGGYETWRCRTSKLEKGSEAIIRAELLKMINTVSN